MIDNLLLEIFILEYRWMFLFFILKLDIRSKDWLIRTNNLNLNWSLEQSPIWTGPIQKLLAPKSWEEHTLRSWVIYCLYLASL